MVVLVTCKMKNIRSKMQALGIHNIIHQFFRRSRADNSGVGGRIWPKFELIQAFMHVLVTYKNKDDSIKNEGARVVTTFSHYKSMGIFPDAEGQLTTQFLARPGRISNSFETLWLSILPARTKNIRSKIKAL